MFWIVLLQLITGGECVYGAEPETLCTSNACFTVHTEEHVIFAEARNNCEHNGGYLMTIRGREEEDVLRSLLSQIQGRRHDRALKLWIGLKLNKGSCVLADKTLRGFQWTSGEGDSHYSNWGEEPVSTCTERCVMVNYDARAQHQINWTARPCKKSAAFYACMFSFKGMCKPLVLVGAGNITYTAPFSEKPQSNEMELFPLGTSADIFCSDHESHFSLCEASGDTFRWRLPGPFCETAARNCAVNNGGCEDACLQDGDGIRCSCTAGYDLGGDGRSCRMRDACGVDTCEHLCVTGTEGFSCQCPPGLELSENQRNCSDIDECQARPCGGDLCVNTHGGYACACRRGYEMVHGECGDVDECEQSRCAHRCLNNVGSFSCHCSEGFSLAQDGHSCACPRGFHVSGTDRRTCSPDVTEASPAAPSEEPEGTSGNHTESSSSGAGELQHRPPGTEPPSLVNVTHGGREGNASLAPSFVKTAEAKILICVLGSVVPLLALVAVILAISIFRCSRSKKEAKKSATADGYCWVSSGLDPRLEKLYESVLTDDL